MKLYKLTNQKHQTRAETQWGEGVKHTTSGVGELCGPGWLHAYESPLLAVLHNPIHGNIQDPVLWEAEGEGEILRDGQMKIGVTKLTTVRQIPLPEVTTVQRQAYAILAAKQIYTDESWNRWADRWLSGDDRSAANAADAARAANAAYAARYAARYAANAARFAANAAYAADAAYAAYAAEAASYAAEAASYAANAGTPLDLIGLAEQAATYK